MEVWKQIVFQQLKQKNILVDGTSHLIALCSELRLTEKKLRTENTSLQQAKSLLQSRVEELEEKVKHGIANAAAKEREDTLQQELNACLRENANAAKTLLEMHEQMKEKDEKLVSKVAEIEYQHKELRELRSAITTLETNLQDKDETISVLKGELLQLQVTLVKSEETVQQLKKENKRLEGRVGRKLEEDVLKLNAANQFFVSTPSAPLEPMPMTTSGSTSILDQQSKTPIGASTIPKSSKKSFQVHAGEVNTIAFSPTGAYFVTGGSDKTVKVWDTYTLANKHTLVGPERTVMQVAFSPNDECVMAASNDNACRIWALNIGRVRHCLLGHLAKIYTAQFSYDNEKMVTGSHDRTLKVWDLQKRFCIRTIFCYSSCNDLCLSRDSTNIISGHLDHQLRFWDLRNGDCIKELANIHSGQITGVTLSPDGRTVLTSSRDNSIKTIDIRTYEVLQTYHNESYRNGLNWTRSCFSPDGRYIASGSMDGTVFVWDTVSTHVEQFLRGVHRNAVTQVAWNPTGYQLASVDRSGFVSLWG